MTGRAALMIAASLALAPVADARTAPPRLVNARVQTRPAAAGLQDVVRGIASSERGPVWIGYAVPVDGGRSMCCWDSVESTDHTACPGCRLEGRGAFNMGSRPGPGGRVNLEADDTVVVMLRAEGGRIGRVRSVSYGCALDAGGLPVYWLDGVRPTESVRLLAGLGKDAAQRGVMDGALMALSVHAEPAAVDALIAAARSGDSSGLRSQALFWLSQKAGERAAAAITRAVQDDPESQVREKAVFALSQLPRDEGVPRLITLARSHRDPRVREKAIFWLGQSEDARALALFEEILHR